MKAEKLKPNPKQKLPEIGPPLRSRKILPGYKREQFPYGKLAAKKLQSEMNFVVKQGEALKEAEKEIYEWRHRHRNILKTLKSQITHELNIRMEIERRHRHQAGLLDAFRSIRAYINGLKA